MNITAAQVKELRDKTGAGMMDCKKALIEAEGDFEKAVEILRKKGASVAAKRAERAANEGLVLTRILDNGSTGVILEVNCETDFVAKSDDFVNFANLAMESLVANRPANVEELLESEFDGKKVGDELTNAIGKIGEKLEISRFAFETLEGGLIVDYIHHGSKLGVLLGAENVADDVKDAAAPVLKDIAMQVAAMKPLYVSRDEVPSEVIEKEKEIYKEVARKEGKPEQILDKIAEGKLNKYYGDVCLVEQVFVKDNSKTVQGVVDEFNKANSSEMKIKWFKRFHLSDENK
ncbi:MAG: elongation factor Ts [Ignavibacteria bacterium]|nr:MAG: elongation factor Ts [Ignavibacteria bacterium]